ncbi:MAG: hypothetical protein JW873_01260 [Candidatus Saganbacteria bacterium]|nr:hypothetical protein [Candidatus Saganbacteria bacterium]
MEIRPSIKSGDLGGRVGADYQGGGGDLLAQLGQRVSDTLGQGKTAEQNKISVDSQLVKQLISGLFNQPLPGLNHDFLV